MTAPNQDSEPVARILAQQVRAEDGDLVSSEKGRCTVVLQGARATQLGAFMERLETRLREALSGSASEWTGQATLLSHPADAERIRGLVGTARAAEG